MVISSLPNVLTAWYCLGLCRGGDLCGLYSALSQDGTLVVEDIPLVVWGLCFGKVGGGISEFKYAFSNSLFLSLFLSLGGPEP